MFLFLVWLCQIILSQLIKKEFNLDRELVFCGLTSYFCSLPIFFGANSWLRNTDFSWFFDQIFLAMLDWNSLANFMGFVDTILPGDKFAHTCGDLCTLFGRERPTGFLVNHFAIFLGPRFANFLKFKEK